MNTNSNSYTVIYATVLTVLVAVVLSCAALGLKSKQDENSQNEKKQQVLGAVAEVLGQEVTFDNAGKIWADLDMDANMMVVNTKGETVEGNAFEIVPKSQFVRGEVKEDATLPVFKAVINGKSYYIMCMYGAGLWDAIWGYIAVEEDGNTVAGATFDHAGETAGLGAKIKDDPEFAKKFIGKHLFKDGAFTSVEVLKPGKKSSTGGDQIDCITGATMTSNGVSTMIKNSIQGYVPFLESLNAAPAIEAVAPADTCASDSCINVEPSINQ